MFESEAEALVNTVNLNGVMGKGVALQFRNKFPQNYKRYREACGNGQIGIGRLFVTAEDSIFGRKYIINFPTKKDWRRPSEYTYIQSGLDDLVKVIASYHIRSIAIPPLGAGNGGLEWDKVKNMIMNKLADVDIDILVYEPNADIHEKIKEEQAMAKLTPARALLLYLLFDLVRHGEYVSEFSSEKVCYFLQRFGAHDLFKLTYEPKYYGPYSGKVRYVLNAINGSYVMGYSDMDKKPFECISLVINRYDEIRAVVENHSDLRDIANRTISFLDGFYSDFGLELLSSVDYLLDKYGNLSVAELHQHLNEWSKRKGKIFSNERFIKIAKEHIEKFSLFHPAGELPCKNNM